MLASLERSLSKWEGPPTRAQAALLSWTRALHSGQVPPLEAIAPLDDDRRTLIVLALSAMAPSKCLGVLQEGDFLSNVSSRFLCRWIEAVLNAHDASILARVLGPQLHIAASAMLETVRRLVAEGRLDAAEQVARSINYWKRAAGLALVELGLARTSERLLEEAIAAVMETPFITIGTGRGADEMEALESMLERMLVLPPTHKAVRAIVDALASLGKAGQRQLKPRRFANQLAQVSRLCADSAAVGCEGWLELAERLRSSIDLDEPAKLADAAIDEARGRIERGVLEPARPREPAAAACPGEVEPGWVNHDHAPYRLLCGTELMGRALEHGDLGAYFDALVATLDPPPSSFAGRIETWRATKSVDQREEALIAVLQADPCAAEHDCIKTPCAVFAELSAIQSEERARRALSVLFERDLVTRTFDPPGSSSRLTVTAATAGHSFSTSRAVATVAAGLSLRAGDPANVQRLLEALIASTRWRADYALFETIGVLAEARAFDLETWERRIPAPRRWALWAATGQLRESLDVLATRFGPLPESARPAVVGVLARAGRFSDALALVPCELRGDNDEFVVRRPPPTCDGLLTLARFARPLDAKQASSLRAAMKNAPRGRDAYSQETYRACVAALEELLGSSAGPTV